MKPTYEELAAQVDVLQNAILESNRYLVSKMPADFQWPAFLNSPTACLAQVRAEAGRAGFIAGYELCNGDNKFISHNYNGFAEKYAETIRQGGAA